MERYLEKLGLEPKEIKVYLVCLQNEKNSPASLTRQTGLKRSTIYFYLEKLITKGLLERRVQKKRHYFSAIPAKEAFDMFFEQKEEQIHEQKRVFQKILPQIVEATKERNGNARVNFLAGKAGMHYAIKKILAEKKDLYWYGSNDVVVSMLGEENFYRRMTLERMKTKTTGYAITDKKILKSRFGEELGNFRQFRFLEKDFDIPAMLIICGNYIFLTAKADEDIRVVLIEDELMAEIIMSMFWNLWNRLPTEQLQ